MTARCFPYPETENVGRPARRGYESGDSKWTDERVADLKRLWALRWSASKIGAYFVPAFTRNAVIGKLHRLGLKRGGSSSVKTIAIKRGRRTNNNSLAYNMARRTKTGALADNRLTMRKRVEAGLPPMEQRTLDTGEPSPRRRAKFAAPDPRGILLEHLTDPDCRWAFGEAPPYAFCARPQKEGSSYCEYHHEVAHTGTTINYADAA